MLAVGPPQLGEELIDASSPLAQALGLQGPGVEAAPDWVIPVLGGTVALLGIVIVGTRLARRPAPQDKDRDVMLNKL